MLCPFCNKDSDKVIDSRSSDQGRVIRRRRQCLTCNRRFTTYERVEETVKLMVVKRDRSRVPYDRLKLLGGLEKACYKRPVSSEQLTKLVEVIEEELFRTYDREVEALDIGRIAAERLRLVDQVAYVRFASVYKKFADVEDFIDEVKQVMASRETDPKKQGKLF